MMIANDDQAKADASQQAKEYWKEARPMATDQHLVEPELSHPIRTSIA